VIDNTKRAQQRKKGRPSSGAFFPGVLWEHRQKQIMVYSHHRFWRFLRARPSAQNWLAKLFLQPDTAIALLVISFSVSYFIPIICPFPKPDPISGGLVFSGTMKVCWRKSFTGLCCSKRAGYLATRVLRTSEAGKIWKGGRRHLERAPVSRQGSWSRSVRKSDLLSLVQERV
jgi:hypothetical protein